MNDFTKEELNILHNSIQFIKKYCLWVSPEVNNLYKKLSDLIDNYCLHTFMTGKKGLITCDDCGKVL